MKRNIGVFYFAYIAYVGLGCLATILLCAVTLASCRHVPPTIVTPQGRVAYQLEDAIDVVNALQHEAIVATHAGKLPRATALKVARYRKAATTVMDKAIDAGTGCAAAVTDATNGLEQLQRELAASDKATLATAIGSARTVLTALGGVTCQQ